MRSASFVVIEASLGRQDVSSRLRLLESIGFRLFDICDNAYFFDQLALVDLMFVNERLRQSEIKLRPWEVAGKKVVWKKWQKSGFEDLQFDNPTDPFQ